MNKPTLAAVALSASILCGWTQGVSPVAPSSIEPKPVTPEPAPAPTAEQPKSPRSPEGDRPINPDEPNLAIKGIIIVKSRDEIHEGGVPAVSGVEVRDIPFLSGPEFQIKLQAFVGRRLTENTIRDLEDAIILYCRQHGRLLVDAILPEQDIENGVLQVWLLEGKVGNVTVQNPGRKWFKDKFIEGQLHLRPGEPVDSTRLNEDLNWLNNNPFRQVDVTFKPGDKLGLTDVQLQVNDRLPVRPYVGYENTGTRYTGVDRFLTGINLGNLFGLDQQVNYQFTSDTEFRLVTANSASYIIPLPWRNTLLFYGSYVDAKADFGAAGGGTTANGTSWQTSMRYSIPLPALKQYRHQLSAGFDFKRSNNNLLAGGTTVLQNAQTDVDQFVLAYSGVNPDPYGRTSFGLELYYSPGELTQYNDDYDFNQLRVGAKADYFYARLHAERITRLPLNLVWVLTGWGQIASQRLLPSEELAMGGYSTVRGYDESVLLGDNGWIIDNEVRTPPFSPASYVHLPYWQDELQLLAFFDYGAVRLIDPGPQDGSDPDKAIYGTGVGLRYTVRKNLTVRFDYGWALAHQSINEHDSRANVGALLSF